MTVSSGWAGLNLNLYPFDERGEPRSTARDIFLQVRRK